MPCWTEVCEHLNPCILPDAILPLPITQHHIGPDPPAWEICASRTTPPCCALCVCFGMYGDVGCVGDVTGLLNVLADIYGLLDPYMNASIDVLRANVKDVIVVPKPAAAAAAPPAAPKAPARSVPPPPPPPRGPAPCSVGSLFHACRIPLSCCNLLHPLTPLHPCFPQLPVLYFVDLR